MVKLTGTYGIVCCSSDFLHDEERNRIIQRNTVRVLISLYGTERIFKLIFRFCFVSTFKTRVLIIDFKRRMANMILAYFQTMKRIFVLLSFTLFFACKNNENNGAEIGQDTISPHKTEYACPMHPEVVTDTAAQCPQCGMNLEIRS